MLWEFVGDEVEVDIVFEVSFCSVENCRKPAGIVIDSFKKFVALLVKAGIPDINVCGAVW